jgi:drug/metabolite transporter (DMT)-like permease
MLSTFFLGHHHLDIQHIPMFRWLQMLCVSVAGVIASLTLNQAVKVSNPLLVSFIRALEIMISYAIQVFFFGQPLELLSIVGSVSVFMAVVLVPMEDYVRQNVTAYLETIL